MRAERRTATVLAACLAGVLLAGCGQEPPRADSDPDVEATGAATAGSATSGAASDHYGDGAWTRPEEDGAGDAERSPSGYTFTPDPKRVPKSADAARRLAERAQLEPADWAAGMVRHEQYESGGTWPVLGGDCVWSRGELPGHVLHTLTRRIDLPAKDGRGLLRGSVTISVHRSERDAEREIKDTVQESVRCPDQDLGGGRQLTGLSSLRFDERDVRNAESSLFESGKYSDSSSSGPQEYVWTKSRIGPVTTAISLKGAEGHKSGDLVRLASDGLTRVLYRVELGLK
ncbi:hypothetical protein QNO07_04050 [Streptomyces sp. 549]|uniref:hypothetical protein n=1 Tax=Streptomyces sp. 549 TaxID=3049076 RepID=UPI0024C326AB|nr:hypothetical protein [Streptomyces sp. 549]MDK1472607.1 hypothetical protein [Streptomyces sp. 549]